MLTRLGGLKIVSPALLLTCGVKRSREEYTPLQDMVSLQSFIVGVNYPCIAPPSLAKPTLLQYYRVNPKLGNGWERAITLVGRAKLGVFEYGSVLRNFTRYN